MTTKWISLTNEERQVLQHYVDSMQQCLANMLEYPHEFSAQENVETADEHRILQNILVKLITA